MQRSGSHPHGAGQLEPVPHDQQRWLEAVQSAPAEAGHDPNVSCPPAHDQRQRTAHRDRCARQRIDYLPPGEPQRTAGDLDHRFHRLALDHAVRDQTALDGGALRAGPHPQRRERAQEREGDTGDEQGRGVEQEGGQREDDATERDLRRPLHRIPAPVTALAPRTRRRRRPRVPPHVDTREPSSNGG